MYIDVGVSLLVLPTQLVVFTLHVENGLAYSLCGYPKFFVVRQFLYGHHLRYMLNLPFYMPLYPTFLYSALVVEMEV